MSNPNDNTLQCILENMHKKTTDAHIQNLALLIKILLSRVQQLESLSKEDRNDR